MVICVVFECNSRQGRPYVFINFLQLSDAPFKPNPKNKKKSTSKKIVIFPEMKTCTSRSGPSEIFP